MATKLRLLASLELVLLTVFILGRVAHQHLIVVIVEVVVDVDWENQDEDDQRAECKEEEGDLVV